MITADTFELYLVGQYGTNPYREWSGLPGVLVVDPSAPAGLRPWTREDSNALVRWLEAQASNTSNGHVPICYNLKQAAEAVGVSVPVFQVWLRRKEHPVPHVRHGRRVIVPHNQLLHWLQEEAERGRDGRA